MDINEHERLEFIQEAIDLLRLAELSLIEADEGKNFKSSYHAVFRSFHSIKGAAKMMSWDDLAQHMHKIEDQFNQHKEADHLPSELCTYFLQAIDHARKLLNHEKSEFNYIHPKKPEPKNPTTQRTINIHKTSFKDKVIKEINNDIDVLVLDDEPDVVEILEKILFKLNLKSIGFTCPIKALEYIETTKPKVIFSDYNMPKLSGIEFLKQLRQNRNDMPFIFISAYLDKENLIDAYNYGATGVVEKPFKEPLIIAQVYQAIMKSEQDALLSDLFNLVLYELPELDTFFKEKNKENDLNYIRNKLIQLITRKSELRKFKLKKSI